MDGDALLFTNVDLFAMHSTMNPRLAPWRPIQYLGCKLRTLDQVVGKVRELAPSGGFVWEPFAGSTVVSQALAQAGYRVWAGDALLSSATFARALLGVGRHETDGAHLESAACLIADRAERTTRSHERIWRCWVELEATALEANDGYGLLNLVSVLPQRWRPLGADETLTSVFESVEHAADERQTVAHGLISSTYAGSYFGLRQALELEAIRGEIDRMVHSAGEQPEWLKAGLLTALAHAASAAVFSPGKHFAQPHKIHRGKDLEFHSRRILSDRSVSILENFVEASKQIEAASRIEVENHRAYRQCVEDVSSDQLRDAGVNVVYADPPYTAQQYSRFYHVLDVLLESIPAKLQTKNGVVTSGLYPEGRYLSPFCSKTRAASAIGDLAVTSASAGASFVLSYSGSVSNLTGNARSVALPEIVRQMERAYGLGSVAVSRVPLTYRQFNKSSSGVVGRDDPEYVVTASPRRADAR